MKKVCSLLLALLLALTGLAACAESGTDMQPGFYLYERRIVPTEEGCVLHLRLLKIGGIQYCLENVDVLLLDAQGQEIVPLSVRMDAPVNPVPAGDCFFPVTLYCTLPEGREAASFQVLGMPGEAFDEPSAVEMDLDAGRILLSTGTGPAVTAWLEEPVTDLYMSGYMAVLYIYDVDGSYLGSTTLSWEDAAVRCGAGEARAKLSEISRLPEELLDYYGIDFNEGSFYYLFDNVPLTGLAADDIPMEAVMQTFCTKSPMTVLTSSFEKLPDGRWRAYALLQNGACEPVHLDPQQAILLDGEGKEIAYGAVESAFALWELDAFSFTTAWMTFTDVAEGAVPAELRVHGRAIHAETSTSVELLPEEYGRLVKDGSRTLLKVSVPWELPVDRDGDGLASCEGIIWYARHPEDNSMISCGFERPAPTIVGEEAYVFDPVEIPNVPEDVTPEMVLFFINAK